MNLTFKKIEIEHFRSFASRQRFELDPSVGLWLLRGENTIEPQLGGNGAGKSSVFAALCWCIYGRTAHGLKNPDIKPWKGKGVPKVTLTIEKDGEPQVIERVAKTNGLTINEEAAGPDDAAKLIGLSFEVFTNTLYLAQGLPLFFDRSPADKLQLFTEVLSLEKWEERSSRAAKKARELETLESEMRGELGGLEIAVQQNEALAVKTRAAHAAWEAEQAAKATRDKAQLANLRKDLEAKQRLLDDADVAYDLAAVRLKEMRADINSLRKTADSTQRQYVAETMELEARKRELIRLLQELKELDSSENCPTCGQPVTKGKLKGHKKELQVGIEELRKDIGAGINKNIETRYKDSLSALRNFEAEIQKAEKQADDAQTKLNVMQPEVQRLKASILLIQDNKQETSNPHTEQLQNLRRQKAQLETQQEELQEDILKAQKQIERTKFWVKGFKDVALYLIEEVLAELEAVTNATLGEIGLVDWRVEYALERETKAGTVRRGINVTVLPPSDYVAAKDGKAAPIRWECWSGGEEQRLRLVGAIALSDVLLRHAGVEASIEIYDEPCKYVSGTGVQELCNYLKDRAQSQNKTLWFIDHLVREGSTFAGTVVVQKTIEGSVIRRR